MYQMMSLPLYSGTFQEYDSWRDLGQELERLGCDGIEGVWGGEDLPKDLPAELILGYHLIFYPDWLDFYRDDRAALKQKFGSLEPWPASMAVWGRIRCWSNTARIYGGR